MQRPSCGSGGGNGSSPGLNFQTITSSSLDPQGSYLCMNMQEQSRGSC